MYSTGYPKPQMPPKIKLHSKKKKRGTNNSDKLWMKNAIFFFSSDPKKERVKELAKWLQVLLEYLADILSGGII